MCRRELRSCQASIRIHSTFIQKATARPLADFVGNNGVHEYVAQGNAHQVINFGFGQIAETHRAGAALALARAKADIAARGLVVTVVQNYYGLVVAERKVRRRAAGNRRG